jgi:hypothetical protein
MALGAMLFEQLLTCCYGIRIVCKGVGLGTCFLWSIREFCVLVVTVVVDLNFNRVLPLREGTGDMKGQQGCHR